VEGSPLCKVHARNSEHGNVVRPLPAIIVAQTFA
jgi:hypothetical protein